jgi:hypothetical protein
VVARPGSSGAGEGLELTCGGSRVSGRGERRQFGRRRNLEKKTYYQEYAKVFKPTGPAKGKMICGGLAGHHGGLGRLGWT